MRHSAEPDIAPILSEREELPGSNLIERQRIVVRPFLGDLGHLIGARVCRPPVVCPEAGAVKIQVAPRQQNKACHDAVFMENDKPLARIMPAVSKSIIACTANIFPAQFLPRTEPLPHGARAHTETNTLV